jgi:Neuraminidase (sialidase)
MKALNFEDDTIQLVGKWVVPSTLIRSSFHGKGSSGRFVVNSEVRQFMLNLERKPQLSIDRLVKLRSVLL